MQNTYISGGGGGSMSTLSSEERNNMVNLSSEESSTYPDESELELGLELSLGGGGGGKAKIKAAAAMAGGVGCRDHYARRILTAKDFPSVLSDKGSSSSSSSSPVTRANNNNNNNGGSCGTKRTADEPSSPTCRSGLSQVVGWPPVKTCRMNSLANNVKLPGSEEFVSTDDKSKSKNIFADNTNDTKKRSSYVKVNMDGILIGRKVDLAAHICYETLARTLDDMFRPSAAIGLRGSYIEEQVIVAGTMRPIRLLDGLSEFVLTYEDKEGDLMLVGDVPWEMFTSSVRRLRIMRTAEANGLSDTP